MPAPNNPTFNKSKNGGISKGYYSRVLFSYCPYVSPPNFAGGGNWTSNADFNGLDNLLQTYPYYCHGNPTLPANYWESGKTLRIKGTLWIKKAKILNMRFGIYDLDNNDAYWLAIQNNNNSHNFSNNADEIIPIEFEVHLQCQDSSNGTFSAQGLYQYNGDLPQVPNIGGNILNVYIYVPIWNGTKTASTLGITPYQTIPTFNFYGSTGDYLYLSRLIIEELA
jgi:hypothetical protein